MIGYGGFRCWARYSGNCIRCWMRDLVRLACWLCRPLRWVEGGITAVSSETGVSRPTIMAGIKQLQEELGIRRSAERSDSSLAEAGASSRLTTFTAGLIQALESHRASYTRRS